MRFALTSSRSIHFRNICLTAAVLGSAGVAGASPTWDNPVGGTWITDSNWKLPATAPTQADDPIFDGSTFTSNARDVFLDQDRVVNSITFTNSGATNLRPVIKPGSNANAKLIVKTGNVTLDGNGLSGAIVADLSNVYVQLGADSTGALADVTGTLLVTNSHATKNSPSLGGFISSAGTTIDFAGNNSFNILKQSDNLLGTVRVTAGTNTSSFPTITVKASNAFGTGNLKIGTVGDGLNHGIAFLESTANTAFTFTENAATEVAGKTVYLSGSLLIPSAQATVVTFSQNLTGAPGAGGTLSFNHKGDSGIGTNTRFILNGATNTYSGDVIVAGGVLEVNGNWTGAGNFTFNRSARSTSQTFELAGTGNISSKNMMFKGVTQGGLDTYAIAAPGTVTTPVGTLTVGSGTANTLLTFDTQSQYLVDIDGANADRLDISGNLKLVANGALRGSDLIFNVIGTPTGSSYTLLTWTGTLTGTKFANETNVPANYQLVYGTNDLKLVSTVPEPATLGLFGLAGLALVSRRRRTVG